MDARESWANSILNISNINEEEMKSLYGEWKLIYRGEKDPSIISQPIEIPISSRKAFSTLKVTKLPDVEKEEEKKEEEVSAATTGNTNSIDN